MTQMPLSFISCPGFLQFMAVLEPNYKPCKEEALKRRLELIYDAVKKAVSEELQAVKYVACTSDCWTSRAQHSYITMTAHIINKEWVPKEFTLTTQLMEERHTAANLCDIMQNILTEWGINDKTTAIITDNAANVTNAVADIDCIEEKSGLTCAAHSLQLAANKALALEPIADICQKAAKLVAHFRHSSIASAALEKKQEQLGLAKNKLIQSCKTRWNSTYEMLERLAANRVAISNVLVDRTLTTIATAQKLEMTTVE